MAPLLLLPVLHALARPLCLCASGASSVYILELAQGRVYVGKSRDAARRLAQHANGTGAAFTRAFPPTGNRLPRAGDVRGGGDAAERDETLRYMLLRGVDMVRGWRYCTVELSPADRADAEANLRELFDLCRRCGNPGHFMGQCAYAYDRLGRALPPNDARGASEKI